MESNMNKKNNMPAVQPLSISTRFFRVEPEAKKQINRSLVAPVVKVVPKDDLSGWFYSR